MYDQNSQHLSIGYYCPGWPPGAFPSGIVTYVSIMAEQLKALGHRVTILADPVSGPGHAPEVYDLELARNASPRHAWGRIPVKVWQKVSPVTSHAYLHRRSLVRTIARAVAERGIDVLEIEESFGWARWLQEALPIPVCVRLHGPWFEIGPRLGYPDDARSRARVKREGRAILAAAGVTAPTHQILEDTRRYYGSALASARVISNPVELDDRLWDPDLADPARILFVGRFDRLKGGDLIVDAFSRVLDAVPAARLRFIGPDQGCRTADGRTRGLVEYVHDRLPGALESKRVEWLGRQPHASLARYRLEASLCVVCSLYETFGYTVIEAMALGCPIVAARVGGIPEMIDDGRNGLLHDPGDAEDLAEKIVSLLRDPARAAELGRQAASDCRRRYEPAVIARQMVEFYRSVARGGGNGRTDAGPGVDPDAS